jgi:hypothetical protein
MSDRTFRFELVSVDNSLWARIKLLFTAKHSLIVHGRYFSAEKAFAHMDLLRTQGKAVYILDTEKNQLVSKGK